MTNKSIECFATGDFDAYDFYAYNFDTNDFEKYLLSISRFIVVLELLKVTAILVMVVLAVLLLLIY